MPTELYPGFSSTGESRSNRDTFKRNFVASLDPSSVNVRHYSASYILPGGGNPSSSAGIVDDSGDSRAMFLAADAAGVDIVVPKGVYRFGTSTTLTNRVILARGAVLKPASGAALSLSGDYVASDGQFIFDLSEGGTVTFTPREISAAHFGIIPGGTGLVALINKALIAIDSSGGGKLKFRPRATYNLAYGIISIRNNTELDCQWATFQDGMVGFYSNAAHDNIVRNLRFLKTDDTTMQGGNYHGIWTARGTRITMDNIRFSYSGPTSAQGAFYCAYLNTGKFTNFTFEENAGAAGVHCSGNDVVLDNWSSDHGQDDDFLALKGNLGGCSNWRINNCYVRGAAAGVSFGSQAGASDKMENITVSNLVMENCNRIAYIKCGYGTTGSSLLGGKWNNISISNFTFRTTDPEASHDVDSLIELTCRKDGTIEGVEIGNGVVQARQAIGGGARTSAILRLEIYQEAGFTATIRNVKIHDITVSDSLPSSNTGRPLDKGIETVLTGASGSYVVDDIVLDNVHADNLENNFITNAIANFGISLRNVTQRGISTNPASTDSYPSIRFNSNTPRIDNYRIKGTWASDQRLPGPQYSHYPNVYAGSAIPIPPWTPKKTFAIGTKTFTSGADNIRLVIPAWARCYIPRVSIVSETGVAADIANRMQWKVSKRAAGGGSDVSIVNSLTSTYALAAYTETPMVPGYHVPHDIDFVSSVGDKSWIDATEFLILEAAWSAGSVTLTNANFVVYYMEF